MPAYPKATAAAALRITNRETHDLPAPSWSRCRAWAQVDRNRERPARVVTILRSYPP